LLICSLCGLNFQAKTGSLISPEKVKKSIDVQKSLELFTAIFHCHSNLFFEDNANKSYFIFLRDILTKISQSDFIGPRLLATSFGKSEYNINKYFLFKYFFFLLGLMAFKIIYSNKGESVYYLTRFKVDLE